MHYKPVTKNTLQGEMNENHRLDTAPSPYTKHEAPCFILEVYDPDKIEEFVERGEFPQNLASVLDGPEDKMYARVRTASGGEITIPIEGSVEEVLMLHGNAKNLVDRLGKITFRNMDLESGTLSIPPRKNRATTLDKLGQCANLIGVFS